MKLWPFLLFVALFFHLNGIVFAQSNDPTSTGFKIEVKPSDVSACYAVCFIIDRSLSMLGTPLDNAIRSASHGVSELDLGDEVGMVSFNETAFIHFPIQAITSDSVRNAAANSVAGLGSSGNTSIGAGLLAAYNELLTADSPDRNFILLSDGLENTEPFSRNVLPLFDNLNQESSQNNPRSDHYTNFLNDSDRIFSIAYGPMADRTALSDIAQQTGGFLLYTPDPNDPLALTKSYAFIGSEIADEQPISYEEATVSISGESEHPFTIGSDVSQQTVHVAWSENADVLHLELERPDGTLITLENWRDFYPDVIGTMTQRVQSLTLREPVNGAWVARIRADSSSVNSTIPYSLFLSARSDLKMAIDLQNNGYAPADSVLIAVSISQQGLPLTGATAVATVLVPTEAGAQIIQRTFESFEAIDTTSIVLPASFLTPTGLVPSEEATSQSFAAKATSETDVFVAPPDAITLYTQLLPGSLPFGSCC